MTDESKKKKPECQICGKGVMNMTRHMKIHNELKPFKCEYCERNFRSKGANILSVKSAINHFLKRVIYQHIFEFTQEKSHSNAIYVKDHFVGTEIYPTTFELIPNISILMLEQNRNKKFNFAKTH